MEEWARKLEAAFQRLQNLQIQPTLSNMELLTASLYDIRDVFLDLEKNTEEESGHEADPERRDGN